MDHNASFEIDEVYNMYPHTCDRAQPYNHGCAWCPRDQEQPRMKQPAVRN